MHSNSTKINIRLLSKLAEEDKVRGDLARRTAVYIEVHEDSSTNQAKQFAYSVEFRKKSIGLVLGKFMPLHKGHELLISFAENFVTTVYVIVDNVPAAPIDLNIRFQWVKQRFPHLEVFYIPSPTPQSSDETPYFWQIWTDCILSLLPQKPNYIFCSESYGIKLARCLNATFIPFDIDREIMPIAASAIRKNPKKYYNFLSWPTYDFYKISTKKLKPVDVTTIKRFCIAGPESTGKTTLTKFLAKYFNTVFVPEYARLFFNAKHKIDASDIMFIAKGQRALENILIQYANKVIFCDTDILMTCLWSKWLYHECQDELLNLALSRDYEHYLLMYPDIPWQDDPVRCLPHDGNDFFQDCITILKKYNRNFSVVTGAGPQRFQNALQFITSYK